MPGTIRVLTIPMAVLFAALSSTVFGCFEGGWKNDGLFDEKTLKTSLLRLIWKEGIGYVARRVVGEPTEKVSLNNFADFVAKQYGVPVVAEDFKGFDLDRDGFITNNEFAECLDREDIQYI